MFGNSVSRVQCLGGTPELRHKSSGVGAALVNQAVARMRLAGCTRVVVSVPEPADSPEAHRFYPRFGWSRWAATDQAD